MSKGLFITAIGTDIGKTYVTGLLVKRLRDAGVNAGYYKAALSGAEEQPDGTWLPGDAAFVAKTANIPEKPENLVSYIYKEAVSPHLAALREGNPVEMSKVEADYKAALAKYDYVTMEGSGGIICPIARTGAKVLLLEDIIRELDMSCLIVADAGLGTINSTVLTVSYLRSRHIPVKGIILNHFHPCSVMEEDNLAMCRLLSCVEVIACVEDGATEFPLSAESLMALYE